MQISDRYYQEPIRDTSLRFAVITALFNNEITLSLEKAAVATLQKHAVPSAQIIRLHVPGAWELPLAAQRVLRDKNADAVIACGCVIRGETGHYDIVANESAEGLMRVMLDLGRPVMNAVLTVENLAQAQARAIEDETNKGAEAARSLIELLNNLHGVG